MAGLAGGRKAGQAPRGRPGGHGEKQRQGKTEQQNSGLTHCKNTCLEKAIMPPSYAAGPNARCPAAGRGKAPHPFMPVSAASTAEHCAVIPPPRRHPAA
ncbi:hypothetical protein A6M21_13725 [Desulfotomaculum copahuensis]|uniref:Uncharacterized protein n=1 Tax=Desulfotomaculum copahuensis TaxID=1838280 RepID=A0A1B7LCF8_9FIRM|nr:hypothetical protein A6M21_13725 [Desulfotomaculum copahuensis]